MEAVAEWPNAPVCGTGFRGFESRQSPEGLGSGLQLSEPSPTLSIDKA